NRPSEIAESARYHQVGKELELVVGKRTNAAIAFQVTVAARFHPAADLQRQQRRDHLKARPRPAAIVEVDDAYVGTVDQEIVGNQVAVDQNVVARKTLQPPAHTILRRQQDGALFGGHQVELPETAEGR